MNVYSTEFFSSCPNNGIRIRYRMTIKTRKVLSVEAILAKVESLAEGYHEEIADDLFASFGGIQTLTADHHGVTIETTRSK